MKVILFAPPGWSAKASLYIQLAVVAGTLDHKMRLRFQSLGNISTNFSVTFRGVHAYLVEVEQKSYHRAGKLWFSCRSAISGAVESLRIGMSTLTL